MKTCFCIKSHRVKLFVGIFIFGCGLTTLAQDSLATVYLYRLGFDRLELVPAVKLWLNDGTDATVVKTNSVHIFHCKPGVNWFTTETGSKLSLNLKPNHTYFIEFQAYRKDGLRQVSKKEAAADLANINKFAAEVLRETNEKMFFVDPDSLAEQHRAPFMQTANYAFELVYNAKLGFVKFQSDNLLVIIEDIVSHPNKVTTRRIFVGDELFTITERKEKKARIQEVRSADGRVITLPAGMVLQNNEPSKTEWTYLINGKPVLRGGFYRLANGRNIRVDWLIPTNDPLLFISCLTTGVNFIAARDATGFGILNGLLLGLF